MTGPIAPFDPDIAEMFERRGWRLWSQASCVNEGYEFTCGVCGSPVDRMEAWGPELELGIKPLVDDAMVAYPCRHTTDDLRGVSASIVWIRKRFIPGPIEMVPA